MGLIYVGKGAFIAGYPARDLSADEVERYGESELLKTGLYEKPAKKASKVIRKEGQD